jgi:hypothetical protein
MTCTSSLITQNLIYKLFLKFFESILSGTLFSITFGHWTNLFHKIVTLTPPANKKRRIFDFDTLEKKIVTRVVLTHAGTNFQNLLNLIHLHVLDMLTSKKF